MSMGDTAARGQTKIFKDQHVLMIVIGVIELSHSVAIDTKKHGNMRLFHLTELYTVIGMIDNDLMLPIAVNDIVDAQICIQEIF